MPEIELALAHAIRLYKEARKHQPITVEAIRGAGVTRPQIRQWLRERWWERDPHKPEWVLDGGGYCDFYHGDAEAMAQIAYSLAMCVWDLLDEIAEWPRAILDENGRAVAHIDKNGWPVAPT